MNPFKVIFSTAFILSISCGTINAQPFIDSTTIYTFNYSPKLNDKLYTMDINNDGQEDFLSFRNHLISKPTEYIVYAHLQDSGKLQTGELLFKHPVERFKSIDINGDGFLDFVFYKSELAYISQSRLKYSSISIKSPEQLIDFADVNFDGAVDLIVRKNGFVNHRLNQGGVFAPPIATNLKYDNFFHQAHYPANKNGATYQVFYLKRSHLLRDTLISYDYSNGQYTNKTYLTVAQGETKELLMLDIDGDGNKDFFLNTDAGCEWLPANGGFSQSIVISNDEGMFIPLDNDFDGDIDFMAERLSDKKLSLLRNTNSGFTADTSILQLSPQYNGYLATSLKLTKGMRRELIFTTDAGFPSYASHWLNYKDSANYNFHLDVVHSDYTSHSLLWDISDFNSDGLLDIVQYRGDVPVLNSKSISWIENLGNYRFAIPKMVLDSFDFGAELKDLDGDGFEDIVVIDSIKVKWYKNNGNAKFSLQPSLLLPSTWRITSGMIVEDFDGDNDLDIITTDHQATTGYFLNQGSGQFSVFQSLSYNPNLQTYDGKVVDFESDGDMDIVYKDQDSLFLYRNDGNFSFTTLKLYQVYNELRSFLLHDNNNDGRTDILINEEYWVSAGKKVEQLVWLEQVQGDSCIARDSLLHGQHLETILARDIDAFVDVDQDGDKDILVPSDSGLLFIENKGGWSMTPPLKLGMPGFQKLIDLNGDGTTECLIIDGNSYHWYKPNFENPYRLKGKVFWDKNRNSHYDTSDYVIPKSKIKISPNLAYAFSTINGEYNALVSSGSYIVQHEVKSPWRLSSDSSAYHVTLDRNNTVADSLDFAFEADSGITQFDISVLHQPFRCDEIVNHWIDVQNTGTNIVTAELMFVKPTSFIFNSSSLNPVHILQDTLTWSLDTLNLFESIRIGLKLNMPNYHYIGDTVRIEAYLRTIDKAGYQEVFSFKDSTVFRCAYDPNDKQVHPKGLLKAGYIEKQKLSYQIRFQNTGNDTAKTIKVRDYISPNLDVSSLEIVGASHEMELSIQGREATFLFNDINLPDTSHGNEVSQGVLRFTIEPKSDISHLEWFDNQARIYFDQNPPIYTNTVRNTIYDCQEVVLNTAVEANDSTLISLSNRVKYWLDCSTGEIVKTSIDSIFSPEKNGEYKLVLNDLYCTDTSLCYTIDLNSPKTSVAYQSNNWSVRAHPNPVSNQLTLTFDGAENTDARVFDQNGSQIDVAHTKTAQGAIFETGNLEPGLYIVHMVKNDSKAVVRFIKY